MQKFDYIIVGLGIAGISFCEQLLEEGKSFIVYDQERNQATANSGGVMNPTVLKRFNAAWNVESFLPKASSLYKQISDRLGKEILSLKPIYRIFANIEEQNNWSVASDKNRMIPFLSSVFIKNTNRHIVAPLGYGEVKGSMQIDTYALLSEYKSFLKNLNSYVSEPIDYDALRFENGEVQYKNISARKIVFCEGSSARNNPFFPQNKLVGNKGEYVIIEAPELKLEVLLKGPVYVIPLGNATYKVGATFTHSDSSWETSTKAREEILANLDKIITCPYEVVGQTVGIRSTTYDRHPLIGSHESNDSIAFLNGLGTRGFLMAPLLAEMLYNHLEKDIPIPNEMDINRKRKS